MQHFNFFGNTLYFPILVLKYFGQFQGQNIIEGQFTNQNEHGYSKTLFRLTMHRN